MTFVIGQNTLPQQDAEHSSVTGYHIPGQTEVPGMATRLQTGAISTERQPRSGFSVDHQTYRDSTTAQPPVERAPLSPEELEAWKALVGELSDVAIANESLHRDSQTEVATKWDLNNPNDGPDAPWLYESNIPHEASHDIIQGVGEIRQEIVESRLDGLRRLTPEAASKMASDTAHFIRAMRNLELGQTQKG